MKFLSRLEKTKAVWGVVALCVFFIFLRMPSVIEPYWYGDEGVYEVIGQAMNHGSMLYRDIWDNKPPLLYILYALAQGDQPTVKIISLFVGFFTVIAFFFLSQKLFKKSYVSVLTTALLALLFGTPLLEANIANAENFILLPIILAGIIIYNLADQNKIKHLVTRNTKRVTLTSGLLLGVAFLFKIVAIFDLLAFLIFFWLVNLPQKDSWISFKKALIRETKKGKQEPWFHSLFLTSCFLLLGFLLPLVIFMINFALHNALGDFIQAAFFNNVDYVGYQNSLFGIPQGLLIFKIILLFIALFFIVRNQNKLSKPALFITLWIVFALFNSYFSGRPYTHYALVVVPSFCLLAGLLLDSQKKIKIVGGLIIVLIFFFFKFQINITRTYLYYQNAYKLITNKENIVDYQTFFDQKTPRDYAIAAFITSHTSSSDKVFIWGNDPQIYVLSHKLPIGTYTVAYHITENNALDETQKLVNKERPKYIIVLKESEPLPIAAPLYIMRYSTSGATIYERSF